MKPDIVERLREIAELKPGDQVPSLGINTWGIELSALLSEAIEEIEKLRGKMP